MTEERAAEVLEGWHCVFNSQNINAISITDYDRQEIHRALNLLNLQAAYKTFNNKISKLNGIPLIRQTIEPIPFDGRAGGYRPTRKQNRVTGRVYEDS